MPGIEQVMQNLNRQINRIQGATLAGLKAAGARIIQTALPLTPIDTGDLRGSVRLSDNDNPMNPHVVVSFGDGAAYAPYVHENMKCHHPVGQAKFLEDAVIQERDEIPEIVAKHIRGVMH